MASTPNTPPPEPAPDAGSEMTISASEIEAAMKAMLTGKSDAAAGAAADAAGSPADVEAAMLAMLEEAEGGEPPAPVTAAPPTSPFVAPDLSRAAGSGAADHDISLLDDVELDVKVELGRTEMLIEDILRLGVGSVVELNKLAGDPVDIYVNARLVARGEILVLNDNFCVRVNDIVAPGPVGA